MYAIRSYYALPAGEGSAIQRCLRKAAAAPNTVVLVVKYLNVDLEIGRAPTLTPPVHS